MMMDYLLKSGAIIALFYMCYKLFLDKETYFISNRLFLITGIALAFIIPFIVIPIYVEVEPMEFYAMSNAEASELPTPAKSSFNFTLLLGYVYLAGVATLLVKSLVEFISLFRVLKDCKKTKDNAITFLETPKNISPFSFFNAIVYNPSMFNKNELKCVIAHEKAHASQWHSLDVLLVQLACTFLWFNPFVWLYKKEVQQNLEFIADQTAQEQSECNKTYQHLLLRTSISSSQLLLANNFYNSLIKKRIVMLHKNPSSKRNQWKLLLVLPLLTAFILNFNTEVIAQTKDKSKKMHTEDAKIFEFVISKDSDDEALDKIKDKLKKHGVTANFKKVKRNDKNEITSISIIASGKNNNAHYSINNDDAISPITIHYNETKDNLSIGNSGHLHRSHDKKVWVNSKNKHKFSNDGDENVVIEIDSDDEEGGSAYVFTSSDGKTHTVSKNVNVTRVDTSVDEEGDKIYVVRTDVTANPDERVVVVSSGEPHKVSADVVKISHEDEDHIKIIGKEGKNISISGTGDSDPMILIDDMESSKEEMEKLDPEKIDRVEVLKGDKATQEYGDKAKDGVIKIYTKK